MELSGFFELPFSKLLLRNKVRVLKNFKMFKYLNYEQTETEKKIMCI